MTIIKSQVISNDQIRIFKLLCSDSCLRFWIWILGFIRFTGFRSAQFEIWDLNFVISFSCPFFGWFFATLFQTRKYSMTKFENSNCPGAIPVWDFEHWILDFIWNLGFEFCYFNYADRKLFHQFSLKKKSDWSSFFTTD